MKTILITGGTGTLGRELVREVVAAGHAARILSRAPRPARLPSQVEWTQVDLMGSTDLALSLAGVQVVFHAASSPFRHSREVDVEATSRLLAAGRAARIEHFVYISIVGIDDIPFPYYQHKVEAERRIAQSDLPWSILRASQFHNLIDRLLKAVTRWPLCFLPTDFQFQPMDVREVATHLARCTDDGPGGRLPDVAGPHVLRLGEMAKIWLATRGRRTLVLPLWLPGRAAAAVRRGDLTNPAAITGQIGWPAWLQETYGWPVAEAGR